MMEANLQFVMGQDGLLHPKRVEVVDYDAGQERSGPQFGEPVDESKKYDDGERRLLGTMMQALLAAVTDEDDDEEAEKAVRSTLEKVTFTAVYNALIRKGKSKESAKKIAGAVMARQGAC